MTALEGFSDKNRLTRGRGYAGDSRILQFDIDKKGVVTAKVRGNVNPYFGVYKEPQYKTSLQMTAISDTNWQRVVQHLGSRASWVSRLLMNEMPDDIESAFGQFGLHLLPRNEKDFVSTKCSCPDFANPCKHIAGVYYRLAKQLDQDPFLLFELRGLPRDKLHDALARSPLGEVLASMINARETVLESADTYYPRPQASTETPDYQTFWRGAKRLPSEIEAPTPAVVPAILVKKAGDYPAFWQKDGSFIEVMEEFYVRMRKSKLI